MKNDLKICERAISNIGNKWSLMILNELNSIRKAARFNELLAKLKPISSKTLSIRLKELTKNKIIEKKIETDKDRETVRIEYELTEKGKDLMEMFKSMGKWEKKWQ